MGFVIGVGSMADIIIRSGGVVPWWMAAGVVPIAAYQAKSAASYAASRINQANPGTFDLAQVNGVVPWAAPTGWGFVAASLQAFDTGVVPTLNQTWTILVQYANWGFVNGTIVTGVVDTVPGSGFCLVQLLTGAGGGMVVFNGSAAATIRNNPALATGNYGFSGLTVYRDGIADALPVASPQVGTTDISLYIGAVNNNGVAGNFPTISVESFITYSSTLTAPQIAAEAAAMSAL